MNVLIADDHPLVRDALARTVQQLAADVQVHEAGDLERLLRLAAQGDADLALVDLNMPGMNGVAGLRRLRETAPTLPVVVASGQEDAATIRAVLAAGAVGFIPKSERPRCCWVRCGWCSRAAPMCPRASLRRTAGAAAHRG